MGIGGESTVGVSYRKPVASDAIRISHVADFQKRYPGDEVTFYSRLDVAAAAGDLRITVQLPPGLEYLAAQASELVPQIGRLDDSTYVVWTLPAPARGRLRREFQVTARVEPAAQPVVLESHGFVADGETVVARETATVHVATASRLVRHLPALYQEDDLMGRYLMVFESFLTPIEQRIETISDYFDPRIAPAHFLPWLATWADFELDERWSEDRQRLLLRSVATLYRKRGTRAGLSLFLQIYTGVTPEISESRSANFELGPANRLGQTVAIGKQNAPQSFHVNLRLPRLTGHGAERSEAQRRRIIESIIEAEKPAHARYTLDLELTDEVLEESPQTPRVPSR